MFQTLKEGLQATYGILNPLSLFETADEVKSQESGKKLFEFLHKFSYQLTSNPRRAEKVLLGLVKIALSCVDEKAVHSDPTRENVKPPLREMLSRYSVMAATAYSPKKMEHYEIVAHYEEEKIEQPVFYVLEWHGGKEAVVVVRGTNDMQDVVTDIDATALKTVDHGTVHRGIWKSAAFVHRELTRPELLKKRKSTFDITKYKSITVTGHSLGAGVSVYLSRLLQKDYPDKKVRCFGFASPPVLEEKYSRQNAVETYCVIHNADLVPRISTQSMVNLENRCARECESAPVFDSFIWMMHALRQPSIGAVRFLDKIGGKRWLPKSLFLVDKFDFPRCPDPTENTSFSMNNLPTLYVPGVVIFKLDQSLEIAKEDERDAKLLVTSKMLLDHASHNYVVSAHGIGGN